MNTPQSKPLSKVAVDADLDYVAAGDEVISLDDTDLEVGILADVEGTEASINYPDGSVGFCHIDRVAHPDSPQAEAFAMFGDPR